MPGVKDTASGVTRTSFGMAITQPEYIENFEDERLDGYADAAGNDADWTFFTNSKEGNVACGLTGETGFPKQYSSGGRGASRYPEIGDEIEFWVYSSATSGGSTCQGGVYIGGTTADDCYWLRHNQPGDNFELNVDNNGSLVATLDSASVSLPGGWYRYVFQWDDGSTFGGSNGDLTLTCYDESDTQQFQLTGNDTSFTDGGFGFWGAAASSEELIFDAVRVTNL